MAIANDNYCGYVLQLIASGNVTWLECAAASVCWNILLVCYLEEPYGHLMLENMLGAQARTQVKVNLFSSVMLWEDVARCCQQANGGTRRAHGSAVGGHIAALPLSEGILATLASVHINGGSQGLVLHLPGVTVRFSTILHFIDLLRRSGYAGCGNVGVNSPDEVDRRMYERYVGKMPG